MFYVTTDHGLAMRTSSIARARREFARLVERTTGRIVVQQHIRSERGLRVRAVYYADGKGGIR